MVTDNGKRTGEDAHLTIAGRSYTALTIKPLAKLKSIPIFEPSARLW